MANRVSMEDIAKKLGISKNTVSLVFRDMPGINEQTRKQILDTATQMGYIYKNKSKQEAQNHLGPVEETPTMNICLCLPETTRESTGFFSHVLFGIEDEAKKNNFNTIIFYFDDEHGIKDIPLCIQNNMVSGIITLGRISCSTVNTLLSFNLPLVMVDHYLEHIVTDCILSDNLSGAYKAVKYLVEKGHQKIGFLGDIEASISFYDRYMGYLKALKHYSLPISEEHIIKTSYEKQGLKDFSLVVENLKEKTSFPSAFFCCNDIEAITLIKGLNSIGLKVPQDISVIGFDDIDNARNFYPELTTLRVEKEYMGKKAVQRLIHLLDFGPVTPEKLLLNVSIIERQSVNGL